MMYLKQKICSPTGTMIKESLKIPSPSVGGAYAVAFVGVVAVLRPPVLFFPGKPTKRSLKNKSQFYIVQNHNSQVCLKGQRVRY